MTLRGQWGILVLHQQYITQQAKVMLLHGAPIKIGWQKDNIDGVIIFEAKLTSTNLSKVQLEDSDQMQNVHSLYLF